MKFSLFVSCPKGLEYLLEEELRALGLHVTQVSPQGVYGDAPLAVVYHLCLWSRIANRVQVILFSGQAYNQQTLYQICHQFPWQTVFSPDKSLCIEFHGSSGQIRNTMFGAQVVKDAIVDYFRQSQQQRPNVDREQADIRLHAYLKQDTLTVSFDLTGYSMHARGYRKEGGQAPLKENVAAALLIRARWPQLMMEGYSFMDPLCGSGTLVIEAAMMAAHIAPGLLRNDQSLHHWAQHQASLWEKLRQQALQQVKPLTGQLVGYDHDARIIEKAQANAARAGVAKLVNFQVQSLKDCQPIAAKGLLVGNPPYGERLGDVLPVMPLYQQLGQVLHTRFQGWHAAILTDNPLLAKAIGLRSEKQYTLYNGPLLCKLYTIQVNDRNQLKGDTQTALSSHGQMFANRLQKNAAHLQKWAKRQQISCYRVYDADLPEYSFAIDIYNDAVVLQEYAPPASVAVHQAEKRRLEVMQAVPQVLGVAPEKMVVKQRQKQKGAQQYQKINQAQQTMVVTEGRAQFKVNLYDYLDTGLFLDHRLLRLKFAELPAGTRFLNCFCYTASASVHAALAGAITTNVDLSKTYLSWAEDNFKLNRMDTRRHQFVHFDCLQWLKMTRDKFDVIFLDPPSFSNSKRMTDTLDVQRDHVGLIDAAMRTLAPGGKLYFSTNLRSFRLAEEITARYSVKDITPETIDLDFKRNVKIHRVYLVGGK